MHEFKSGVGYLALRSRADVLPVLISGTHEVLGKGALIPRRHSVEVRVGRVITADELQSIADSADRAGAYRTVADHLRNAVLALAGRPRALREVPQAITQPGRVTRARKVPEHAATGDGNGRSRKRAKA